MFMRTLSRGVAIMAITQDMRVRAIGDVVSRHENVVENRALLSIFGVVRSRSPANEFVAVRESLHVALTVREQRRIVGVRFLNACRHVVEVEVQDLPQCRAERIWVG